MFSIHATDVPDAGVFDNVERGTAIVPSFTTGRPVFNIYC